MRKKIDTLITQTINTTKNEYSPDIIKHLFLSFRDDCNSLNYLAIRIPHFGLFYLSPQSYRWELTKAIRKLRKDKSPELIEYFRKLWKNRHNVNELQIHSRSRAYKAKGRSSKS